MNKFVYRMVIGLLILFGIALITGCSAEQASTIVGDPASLSQIEEQALPTLTLPSLPPTATSTPLPPTATFTPTASATPTETATPSPTPTETQPPPTASGADAIYIYLIQKDTGGPVGCGDTAVKINTGLYRTGDVAQDVATALRKIMVKAQYFGSLYNPTYLSNWQIDNVKFNPGNGLVEIQLSGTYVRSGDRCDDARVRAQIYSTVKQFPGITQQPFITLNGNILGDYLATLPRQKKDE